MLLVLKFGGTSVGTPDRIRAVAKRVAAERRAGHALVVVVSAMGHTTDELLALAEQVTEAPGRRHPRELDMLLTAGERIAMSLLSMAIADEGVDAVSLTGSQAAIITDEAHTVARIEEVRATRVREELERERVVIVAGFQGVSRSREITTLGRGGSDTTAVALAAALSADRCDVYTDVDGVYTADPRRVPGARRIEKLDYEEILELANSGAQVMHPRAVEIGARFEVTIRVLSSFDGGDGGGTVITRVTRGMEDMVLTGLACEAGHARVLLRGLPAGMDTAARVLTAMSEANVSVDMVAMAERADGRHELQLTLKEDAVPQAEETAGALLRELGGEEVAVQRGLARLALVGSGMHGRPGVYALAFRTLAQAGIEVHGVSTSAISIALLVPGDRADDAQRALHDAFDLAGSPATSRAETVT